MRINIKPISVNDCWKGRRFKTPEYKRYADSLAWLIPRNGKLPEPPYQLIITFGLSSILSDWDNPVKPFQDILSKRYGFNDKLIHRAVVEKVKVDKGKEYIEFEILNYTK